MNAVQSNLRVCWVCGAIAEDRKGIPFGQIHVCEGDRKVPGLVSKTAKTKKET